MEKQININVPPEVACGAYSNLVIITHASSEFILDFAQNAPGVDAATVRARIIMTPEHAKRLLGALKENISKYEASYGTIMIPGRGAAGFIKGPAEA